MFLGQTTTATLTNQTVAVGVLAMILTGIAWLVKQLFQMLPSMMERLDRQEEKRAEALRELAQAIKVSDSSLGERIEKANDRLGNRLERSNFRLGEHFRECLLDVRQSLDEANQLTAMFLSSSGNDGKTNRMSSQNREKIQTNREAGDGKF